MVFGGVVSVRMKERESSSAEVCLQLLQVVVVVERNQSGSQLVSNTEIHSFAHINQDYATIL